MFVVVVCCGGWESRPRTTRREGVPCRLSLGARNHKLPAARRHPDFLFTSKVGWPIKHSPTLEIEPSSDEFGNHDPADATAPPTLRSSRLSCLSCRSTGLVAVARKRLAARERRHVIPQCSIEISARHRQPAFRCPVVGGEACDTLATRLQEPNHRRVRLPPGGSYLLPQPPPRHPSRRRPPCRRRLKSPSSSRHCASCASATRPRKRSTLVSPSCSPFWVCYSPRQPTWLPPFPVLAVNPSPIACWQDAESRHPPPAAACWASAGYTAAGCLALEQQLRDCADGPQQTVKKANTINHHLSRMQQKMGGRKKK